MSKRPYRMRKRAEARDQTRERIVRATMQLHDEKGVATTTFSDVAERAEVGPATVYRNFPTIDALIAACGMHVWQDMRPPVPPEAPAHFEGLATREARLERLIEMIDSFYRRGELRLVRAGQDRHRIAGLDYFLTQVEAGVEAHVRHALGNDAPDATVRLVLALTDIGTWSSLRRFLPDADLRPLLLELISRALSRVDARA